MLDDGRITDSQGRTVDFKNTVIIMTSNIGSNFLLEDRNDEFISEDVKNQVMTQLRGHFRPEFLNRVDETILFKPLSLQDIKMIVVKLIAELQRRLEAQQIQLSITEGAKEYIAANGFDPVYGARPLKRFIQRNVETMLAREIIAGHIGENSAVQIILQNDTIKLSTIDR